MTTTEKIIEKSSMAFSEVVNHQLALIKNVSNDLKIYEESSKLQSEIGKQISKLNKINREDKENQLKTQNLKEQLTTLRKKKHDIWEKVRKNLTSNQERLEEMINIINE